MSTADSPAAEAARRVEFCLRKGRDHLNLAGLGLTELPPDFVKLTGLRYLDLTGNQLSSLPNAICTFSELRWLGANFNRLVALPERISDLKKLKRLYLRENRITLLPNSFGGLSSLIELDLHGNQIANLPRSFQRLLERPDDQLLHYDLDDNPGEVTVLAKVGRQALWEFLDSVPQQQPRDYHGKLLLVGEGRMGKSTLLDALREQPFRVNKSPTHGLKVEPLDLASVAGRHKDIHLNCWDFSGQVELRETHQIFFTAPAIYLLVWNAGVGEHAARLADWLWLIKHRTEGRAKVLIVATNAGQFAAELEAAENIKTEFGGPDGILLDPCFLKVECDDKIGQINLDALRRIIVDAIQLDESFRQLIPSLWMNAQKQLETRAQTEPFLPFSKFTEFCLDHGIGSPDAFARTQSKMGRLVWADQGHLAKIVILNPHWFSKAIGFVLHDHYDPEAGRSGADKKLATGILPETRMHATWCQPNAVDEDKNPEAGYPEEIFPTFHLLMEAFDLSHHICLASGERHHLVPNRLSVEKPDAWEENWNQSEAPLRRRIDLLGYDGRPLNDWLASAFFYRLMVRLQPDALGRDDYVRAAHWRHGFRLEVAHWGVARVLRQRHQLYYEAGGIDPQAMWSRMDLTLDTLVRELDEEIHLQVRLEKLVPCRKDCARATSEQSFFHHDEIARWATSPNEDERLERIPCRAKGCTQTLKVADMWAGTRRQTAVELKLEEIDHKLTSVHQDTGVIRGHAESMWMRFENLRLPELVPLIQQSIAGQNVLGDRLDDLKRFVADTQSAFQAVMRQLDDYSRRGPRLFSIVPDKPQFWKDRGEMFGKKFRLYLHCERCLLPVSWMKDTQKLGEFTFEITREWWSHAETYVKGFTRILSWFGPASGLALEKDSTLGGYLEAGTEQAEQVEKLLALPESPSAPTIRNGDAQLVKADGSTLQWLHAFLAKQTMITDLRVANLGLQQVHDKASGTYLWVHPSQARYYTEAADPG